MSSDRIRRRRRRRRLLLLAVAGTAWYAWWRRREPEWIQPDDEPVAPGVAPPAPELVTAPQPVVVASSAEPGSAEVSDATAQPLVTPATTAQPAPDGTPALPDGSPPGADYTIKGNAGSMLFHTPSSPYYKRTKAEVWFRTAEEAEAAGFTAYTPRRRATR